MPRDYLTPRGGQKDSGTTKALRGQGLNDELLVAAGGLEPLPAGLKARGTRVRGAARCSFVLVSAGMGLATCRSVRPRDGPSCYVR
jgi:hypothetical protein